jgi:antitoxin ParD1/3/4
MPTRNVNLTQHYDRFVEGQIVSGRFKNASEVMRAGLRLLEQQTAEDAEKLAALRALAAQAFDERDRGQGVELDGSTDLEKHIAKLGRRAAKRVSRSAKAE